MDSCIKMADTNQGSKCKVEIVANIGGQGLGPNMTIILLIHSIHGSSLAVDCRDVHRRKNKHHFTITIMEQKSCVNNTNAIILEFLKHILAARHVDKFLQGIYYASRLFNNKCKEKG